MRPQHMIFRELRTNMSNTVVLFRCSGGGINSTGLTSKPFLKCQKRLKGKKKNIIKFSVGITTKWTNGIFCMFNNSARPCLHCF